MDEVQVDLEMVDEFVTYPKSATQKARIECLTKVPNGPNNIFTVTLGDIQDGRVRLVPIADDGFEGYFVNCSGSTLYCKTNTRKYICDWLHKQSAVFGTQIAFK